MTSAALVSGDWVYSPCQPAYMESVIRKWADGDILQISPHSPPAAIWVKINDNENKIFEKA